MSGPANLAPARGARTPEPEADTAEAAAAAESAGLITRLGRLWERGRLPSESEVRRLFEARLTDVAANKLARRWCEQYGTADGKDRRLMLAALAQARATFPENGGEGARLFKRFNAQPQGLRFLVELRADMLRWRKQVAGIQALDKDLEGLLSAWFDVGLLELRPLTWDSPASLLEKLILYEAVHEIKSWDDLRRRVSPDRRCYAYFHPQMPGVPLIFVEVAFASQMADDVQVLLDSTLPPQDLDKARWAIFYSISNTQPGLKGISFGNFLLKRVVEQLLDELPKLKSFATLSPIPGFADWLGKLDAEAVEAIVREDKVRAKARKREGVPDGQRWVARLASAAQGKAPDVVRRAAFRLAASYLQSMKNGLPVDPVARFHLGNGARIERLNWAADTSPKGLKQSCAMMVNYLYDLDELDDNLARLGEGKPQVSRGVGRVA
ncbi:malonyl-CoA decarboxylase [Achromobacter denitrificans]|uniref:malonyl-CoA decarboxylase domain-containing protein n=1 Tax=Achromobacter denitrificans TaxID=32002 RepID=UPI001666539A|nr:malonyl-CoA decarboxylase family protein [Achromobacter denitrificans]GFN28798.1 malonyl-CoA decarboxylase [Achromobacter denitrificans]